MSVGRSPYFLPHPIPRRAVTQGDALDRSRESLPLESIAFSRKYGTRFRRSSQIFIRGSEHKKNIWDLRHKETRRSNFYGSCLSCGGPAFGAITVRLIRFSKNEARSGRKELSPVEPQGGLSFLPLSPKAHPGSLEITPLVSGLRQNPFPKPPGVPPAQEFRLRLKNGHRAIFVIPFICSNLRNVHVRNHTDLPHFFLWTPGTEVS